MGDAGRSTPRRTDMAAPKVAVWMGPGAAMHPRGTYSAMAVHALNGLLGSIDVEGGVWQSSSAPTAETSTMSLVRTNSRNLGTPVAWLRG